jgi:hypothetical protein
MPALMENAAEAVAPVYAEAGGGVWPGDDADRADVTEPDIFRSIYRHLAVVTARSSACTVGFEPILTAGSE